MSQTHTACESTEVVDVRSDVSMGEIAECTPMHHGSHVEVVRMTLPAGKDIPVHHSPGERVLYCIEGHVDVELEETHRELSAGQMLCLPAHAAHGIHADQDSLLLATNIEECHDNGLEDVIDQASDESFPASDPPAQTPVTGENSTAAPKRRR